MPSKSLPGGLSLLDFAPSATTPMINLGKADAQKAISLGEGTMY
jgi:hypothetical protein